MSVINIYVQLAVFPGPVERFGIAKKNVWPTHTDGANNNNNDNGKLQDRITIAHGSSISVNYVNNSNVLFR